MNWIFIKNFIKNYLKKTKFYAIFLIKPLKKKLNHLNYTTSHYNKGENYHEKFEKFIGRKIIWNLEKKIIGEFIKNKKITNHLDFAAGTGRIAEFLQNDVSTQCLLDSSEKMLSHAKKILNLNQTTFIDKDFTKIELKKKFDLITAFRFFPNAEILLRDKAMKFISEHLNEDGILIMNNHYNFWSIPLFISRLTFRSDGFGMTHGEIIKLIKKNNLELIQFKSVGVFTKNEKKTIIPWFIISKLENFIYKKFSNHKIGYNVIYLIKK